MNPDIEKFVRHPLSRPDDPGDSPGKRPIITGWQKLKETPDNMQEYISKGYNQGAVCGKASGITVIDLDHDLFVNDIFNGFDLNTLKSARTQGRGHIYFKYTDRLPASKHHDLGIEILSDGNNVVIPPSIHPSGDVYKWINPDAPIIEMLDIVRNNLLSLFQTETELKRMFASCRHCFRDVLKKHPDMHGAEGRECMLAACTDLKAAGAVESHIKMFAKLMYGKEYDEARTLQEWRNIDASKTWRCETIKAKLPSYIDFNECDKCDKRRNNYKVNAEETTNNAYEPETPPEQTEEIQERRIKLDLPEDHIISQYVKWGESVTDAYREYHILNGLWLLSAATNRKVVMKLRQEHIRPNLWIMTLGNSTTSRKSTAVNKARKIFECAADTSLPNDDFSLEGYLESLADCPIMHNVKDEASGLLAKFHQRYNDGIFDFECSVYDGSPEVLQKRLASGKAKQPKTYTIKDYYVTKLYATTPDKLARCMSIDDFMCGYGYRWIYNYPKYKHDRKPMEMEQPEDVDAWTKVLARVRNFSTIFKDSKEHEFKASAEVMSYYDSICIEMETKAEEQNNDVLNSVIGRAQIHILKIAMLLELGKAKVSTTMTEESIKIASEMVTEFFIPSIMEIIDRLQEDIRNNFIEKIVAILRRLGGTGSHTKLLRDSNMKSKEFTECITTMLESQRIKIENEKPRVYKLVNHNNALNLRNIRKVRNVRSYIEGDNDSTNITKTASIDACTPSHTSLRTYERYELHEQNELPVKSVTQFKDFGQRAKDWEMMNSKSITNETKIKASMDIAQSLKKLNVNPDDVLKFLEKSYGLTPEARS